MQLHLAMDEKVPLISCGKYKMGSKEQLLSDSLVVDSQFCGYWILMSAMEIYTVADLDERLQNHSRKAQPFASKGQGIRS